VVEPPEGVETEEDLRLATLWAVVGGRADIWIGGKFTWGFGFLGSVDDRVYKFQMAEPNNTISQGCLTLPRFLPISTEILLSLLSLSSFLCLSFSNFSFSFSASLALWFSLTSLLESLLSACRLLLELDPLSNDGSPRLNTDDFFCANPGTEDETELKSFWGELLALVRGCPAETGPDNNVGDEDVAGADDGCSCMDWDDDRRKKGIEEGVRRFEELPRRTEDVGLRGSCWGASAVAGWCVLPLESVPDRLPIPPSGVFEAATEASNVGDLEARTDPVEDIEAKEAAEDIASRWTADHAFLEFADGGESACSLDMDLRSCWLNEIDRGLAGNVVDFEADDGEPVNLRLRAEKLHFFEGVLSIAGEDSGGEVRPAELEL
jgi:hypothetical protein